MSITLDWTGNILSGSETGPVHVTITNELSEYSDIEDNVTVEERDASSCCNIVESSADTVGVGTRKRETEV